MRFFLILFLYASLISAQFNQNDYKLVKETFNRNFEANVFKEYLNSQKKEKIVSALTALSNSTDTNIVPYILNLDFQPFSKEIPFTLGQIGYSAKSVNYLLSHLNLKNDNAANYEIYKALGKIGDSTTYSILFNNLNSKPKGIELSLPYFLSRKIVAKDEVKNLLTKIVLDEKEALSESMLWVVERIGSDSLLNSKLLDILSPNNRYSAQSKIHALRILNRNKFKFSNSKHFELLANNSDWRIRNEAAKLLAASLFAKEHFTDFLMQLIQDTNPNVSRTTAVSLKGLSKTNKSYINFQLLQNLLKNSKLTDNCRGEILISIAKLFPDKFFDNLELYYKYATVPYLLKTIYQDSLHVSKKLDFLSKVENKFSKTNSNDYTLALLYFQDKLYNNSKYQNLILELVDSGSFVALGNFSFISDSLLISAMSIPLKSALLKTIKNYKNDFNFSESLPLITELLAKIDSSKYQIALEELSDSKIYSVKNYALKKVGKNSVDDSPTNFEQLWKYAFKYKFATVKTTKGNFTFKFSPEYSPISVGNFCSLAESGFFDKVIFHRVVPNFVIQTGDTTGTGWGGPNYEIKSEVSLKPYLVGAVGMASAGKDTEGSQWFVMHSNARHLDGNYSNFATITEGQNIVDVIDQGDRIISIILNE